MNPTIASPLVREFLQNGRVADCPVIDMHGHWGPMPGGTLPAAPEDRMMAALARANVRHIVCAAHDALFGCPDNGNKMTAEAIRRNPGRVSGWWAVNPNYPAIARRAPDDLAKADGFIGFKILPDYHGCPATGDRYRPMFEYADAHGLPVLIHTWGGSPFNSPEQVDELAGRHPRVVLVMGHSGFGAWELSADIARRRPNVYLELTAVYAPHDFGMLPGGSGTPLPLMSQPRVSGIIELFVERAGSRKVLFGTDMPWYSPFFAMGAVLFAHITDDDRRNILYRNARRLLPASIRIEGADA